MKVTIETQATLFAVERVIELITDIEMNEEDYFTNDAEMVVIGEASKMVEV